MPTLREAAERLATVTTDLDRAYATAVMHSEILRGLASVTARMGADGHATGAANAVVLHDELIALITQAQVKSAELTGCLEHMLGPYM